MSINESLNHAEIGVVQAEQRVQSFLMRVDDGSEDPIDLQVAARECAQEIEVAGNSLMTPEFAKLAYRACSVLPEPPPQWTAYEELHNRLHYLVVAMDLARNTISKRCRDLRDQGDHREF